MNETEDAKEILTIEWGSDRYPDTFTQGTIEAMQWYLVKAVEEQSYLNKHTIFTISNDQLHQALDTIIEKFELKEMAED